MEYVQHFVCIMLEIFQSSDWTEVFLPSCPNADIAQTIVTAGNNTNKLFISTGKQNLYLNVIFLCLGRTCCDWMKQKRPHSCSDFCVVAVFALCMLKKMNNGMKTYIPFIQCLLVYTDILYLHARRSTPPAVAWELIKHQILTRLS